MVKRELIKEISERMSITQVEAKQFVKVFQDILTEELQQNRPLELQGFGTFTSWETNRACCPQSENGGTLLDRASCECEIQAWKIFTGSFE